eukprot:scaffold124569_cov27-Tisochrysis_lutea.AAC.1
MARSMSLKSHHSSCHRHKSSLPQEGVTVHITASDQGLHQHGGDSGAGLLSSLEGAPHRELSPRQQELIVRA